MTMEDYKEKYEMALERARQSLTYPDMPGFMRVDVIFPELAESEDEKIRKEVIDFICWATDRGCITKEQREKSNSWLAWIEKQKEQKQVEWSEEDKTMIEWLEEAADNYWAHEKAEKIITWLKSLRPSYYCDSCKLKKSIQSWKPSDLPHWKKSNLPDDNSTGFNSDCFCYKGYKINYKELFEKLPKDD